MLTTPAGPEFVKNTGQSGAKSGDHTHQHRALGRRTPHQAYLARPKATPTGTPLHTGASASATTASTTTASSPCATTAAYTTSRMGRRHAGTHVLLLIHDLHIRVVTTDGHLLRERQLDPTKTTNRKPNRERCPKTHAHFVPTHHIGAPDLRARRDSNSQPSDPAGSCRSKHRSAPRRP